jgi:hypothetical protein
VSQIIVKSQDDLDSALKKAAESKTPIEVILSEGRFEIFGSSQVTASGSSQVRAYGSSQVTAFDSSQVRAYGSSQVTAFDSSQVTTSGSSQVRAYDSSQVTASGSSQVRAFDSSQVRAYGSSQVTASKYVAVTRQIGHSGNVTGGVVIAIQAPKSAKDWCAFRGLTVAGGVVILYKAVRGDYSSSRGFSYLPGTSPSATDWDGGKKECGGGLHFCASPHEAVGFDGEATRFLACPVALKDIRKPKATDAYPHKVKARGICGPIVEVDIDGNPLQEEKR